MPLSAAPVGPLPPAADVHAAQPLPAPDVLEIFPAGAHNTRPAVAGDPDQSSTAQARTLLVQALGGVAGRKVSAWATALIGLPQGPDALASWVVRYLAVKLGGRSAHTVAARGRDLTAFCLWMQAHLGPCAIGGWMPAHTHRYLEHLACGRNLAPTSINRALWSLKHFAGWALTQPGAVFTKWGHPAVDAKEIRVEEAPCKKISAEQARHLMQAAQDLAEQPVRHGLQRPRRDLAILMLLLCTGLRVSELTGLRRHQYQEGDLHQVSRKGSARSRLVLLPAQARQALDAYLASEWRADVEKACGHTDGGPQLSAAAAQNASMATLPLFAAAGGQHHLDRTRVGRIIAKLAKVATADGQPPWHVHPHQLRHTFGAHFRARSGSDTETAAVLGHASLKYVGRYVRQSTQERRRLVEDLFASPTDDDDTSSTAELAPGLAQPIDKGT